MRLKFPALALLVFVLAACTSRPGKTRRPRALKVPDSIATPSSQAPGMPHTEKADLEFRTEVDVLPAFKGGRKAMEAFIRRHIVYPKLARQLNEEGRVIVAARSDENGQLSDFSIRQTDDALFNAEALRLVRMMPRWVPARKGGRSVPTTVLIPVMFRLHPPT